MLIKERLQMGNDIKTAKIVAVDNVPFILEALNIMLLSEGCRKIYFFEKPVDAPEFLKENKPDLIISDFQMPKMDGLEFLCEAKKLYPNVSRILLTDGADREDLVRAINQAEIFRYIEKPWYKDYFLKQIQDGILKSKGLDYVTTK
jgi:response regulator RpfG family c-di-GMP phosphodiesterase